MGLMGLIL